MDGCNSQLQITLARRQADHAHIILSVPSRLDARMVFAPGSACFDCCNDNIHRHEVRMGMQHEIGRSDVDSVGRWVTDWIICRQKMVFCRGRRVSSPYLYLRGGHSQKYRNFSGKLGLCKSTLAIAWTSSTSKSTFSFL